MAKAKVNTFGIPSKLKLSLGKRGRPDLQKINRPKTNQGANELFNKGGNTMNSKKKLVKRVRRFQEGGEAALKAEGLAASNKEAPVGFFERLRMGNIDQEGSEAYNRFGAGRAKRDAASKLGVSRMVDQDLADQEATEIMKRNMAASYKDESENPVYKDESENPVAKSAPVMRKPKPTNYSNEGRSSKAPAYSNEGRGSIPKKSGEEMSRVKTVDAPKAIADFFVRGFTTKRPPMSSPKFRASQGYASGGSVSASKRADGIAVKGKTRGKIC